MDTERLQLVRGNPVCGRVPAWDSCGLQMIGNTKGQLRVTVSNDLNDKILALSTRKRVHKKGSE